MDSFNYNYPYVLPNPADLDDQNFIRGGAGSSNPFEDPVGFMNNYARFTRSVTNSVDDRSHRFEDYPRRRSTSAAVPSHSFHHQDYEADNSLHGAGSFPNETYQAYPRRRSTSAAVPSHSFHHHDYEGYPPIVADDALQRAGSYQNEAYQADDSVRRARNFQKEADEEYPPRLRNSEPDYYPPYASFFNHDNEAVNARNNYAGKASSSTSYNPYADQDENYKPHSDDDSLTELPYDKLSDEELGEEVKYIEEPETFGEEDNSDPERDTLKLIKGLKRNLSSLNPMKLSSLNPMKQRLKTCRQVPICRGETYVVCVDGYYRKPGKGNKSVAKGGFGIIIRRKGGESIVAKTGCARVGVSAFYHTVEGIKKGLELVAKYPNITQVYVMCNSDWVVFNINQCFLSNRIGSCDIHPRFGVFCETCLRCNVDTDTSDEFDAICGFLKEIVDLGKRYCRNSLAVNCGRYLNKAADFLAKMQLARGEEKVFEPREFPTELQRLVRKMDKQGELLTHPH